MKILISGSRGLIGSALVPTLEEAGHKVSILARSKALSKINEISWDPLSGFIEEKKLEGFNAVINLAGENISSGRWTPEKMALIQNSRVNGTQLIAETIAHLKNKPKILLSASAVGFYGNRGNETLNENSLPGSGFLAETCKKWEKATELAIKAGIRTAHLRFGVVLSIRGGALAKMLFPFKLGIGGKIGNGSQYISWISINDATGTIQHILNSKELNGPINIVGPEPVTNKKFVKILGETICRPTFFAMPAFMAQFAFGKMAGELLLSSARVEPAKLLKSNYNFKQGNIVEALENALI